jgi:putative FmdB family regulatory protein
MTYHYYCDKCKKEFAIDRKMGKAPHTCKCQRCGEQSLRVFGINVRVPNPTHEARRGRGKG